MLKSLRYRLLLWFVAFVIVTAALVIPANLLYESRQKNVGLVTRQINDLHIDFLKDTKAVNDFLAEPRNTDFFARGTNSSLSYHLSLSASILADIHEVKKEGHDFGIGEHLDRLSSHFHQYNKLIDSLVYLVYKRGYRNNGLEGELNDYGSLLESAAGLREKDVYRLRRIESDYFLGDNPAPVNEFMAIIQTMKRSLPEAGHDSELLENYEQAFLRLIELDQHAGIRKNMALRAELNKQSTAIENIFSLLATRAYIAQEALISRLTGYYILSLLLILALSVFFSYAASRHIVSRFESREFMNLLSQLKIWEKQRDTAIQRAEDTQRRYRELADMLPQSIFETDIMGNFSYVNKAWHKAFGYSENDLKEGLNLIETLVRESEQDSIMAQGKIENLTFVAMAKDGRRFPVSLYSDPIVRDGKNQGRRGIIIDITDKVEYIRTLKQETSRARSSDELKSSFLANMSHEIRTPMNSIIGFSNLLASDQIPDIQKKDFAHYIKTSSEILLNLVDDIIDIAKIEAGELKIVKKECELYALGRELLNMSEEVRKKFNKLNLELIYTPAVGQPDLFIKTDPFRLRQILINLITNAIKFTEKGAVEFGFIQRDERFLEFFVKDTGVGLTRDEIDVIFERFKRARRSDEKNIVGTGLGLAISRNLVQLLGGEMWVDSLPGKGTTFSFTLPYLKITRIPGRQNNTIDQNTVYEFKGSGILVAEDDPANLAFLKEVFQPTGAVLYHAANGREAVDIFRQAKRIDLVIMDIQMPEMDGYEAVQQIRTVNENVPVIAQTAFAMMDDREKMKQAGFDDYVSKPIDIPQLMAIVHRWLKKSRTGVQALQKN